MHNFAAFILTHGRPQSQYTYKALRAHGYTGPVYFVVDNEDKTLPAYQAAYGERVQVFDKRAIAATFDNGDTNTDYRSVVYARNACYDIARRLGVRYFIQLDDDYITFEPRILASGKYVAGKRIKQLDKVFALLLQWLIDAQLDCVAISQGGDWIGGGGESRKRSPSPWYKQFSVNVRKIMNSFILDATRPVQFVGRINEDVNTYVVAGGRGAKFFTMPTVMLQQRQTQTNAGGMTELYKAQGTYTKSFFTIMMAPSCSRIAAMGDAHKRLHHRIAWKHAVPVVIPERFRKHRPNNEEAT